LGGPIAVAGTTESGAIVLKPQAADACESRYGWRINAATGENQSVRHEQRITQLYDSNGR
jgi:hypothetical protein